MLNQSTPPHTNEEVFLKINEKINKEMLLMSLQHDGFLLYYKQLNKIFCG